MLGGQRQEEGDAQDAVQRRRSEKFSRRERRKRRGRRRELEKDYEHAGARADACCSCRFGRRDTAVGKKNG